MKLSACASGTKDKQTNTNVLTKYALSIFDIEVEAEENENCTKAWLKAGLCCLNYGDKVWELG